MISRGRRGVIAVIGGKDNEVLLFDWAEQAGKCPVELLESSPKSVDVISVAAPAGTSFLREIAPWLTR